MTSDFSALSQKQRDAAQIIVQNSIDSKRGAKKLSQDVIGQKVGVTGRTIRAWNKDSVFLKYLEHLSRQHLQAAMPDFVGVLIANLERGHNVSTKQLDLLAKVGDWAPDKKASTQTINVQLETSDIEDRIRRLEQRKEALVIPQSSLKLEAEELVYRDVD